MPDIDRDEIGTPGFFRSAENGQDRLRKLVDSGSFGTGKDDTGGLFPIRMQAEVCLVENSQVLGGLRELKFRAVETQ